MKLIEHETLLNELKLSSKNLIFNAYQWAITSITTDIKHNEYELINQELMKAEQDYNQITNEINTEQDTYDIDIKELQYEIEELDSDLKEYTTNHPKYIELNNKRLKLIDDLNNKKQNYENKMKSKYSLQKSLKKILDEKSIKKQQIDNQIATEKRKQEDNFEIKLAEEGLKTKNTLKKYKKNQLDKMNRNINKNIDEIYEKELIMIKQVLNKIDNEIEKNKSRSMIEIICSRRHQQELNDLNKDHYDEVEHELQQLLIDPETKELNFASLQLQASNKYNQQYQDHKENLLNIQFNEIKKYYLELYPNDIEVVNTWLIKDKSIINNNNDNNMIKNENKLILNEVRQLAQENDIKRKEKLKELNELQAKEERAFDELEKKELKKLKKHIIKSNVLKYKMMKYLILEIKIKK